MLLSLRPLQSTLLPLMMMLLFVSPGLGQSDSRRAVSEHQLMHDRGRTVQSLKRLIWLSSAIEGLHTAQTRGADLADLADLTDLPPELPAGLALDPDQASLERIKDVLRQFFKSVKQ